MSMSYESETLQAGGQQAEQASVSASHAAGVLAGIAPSGTPFGDVGAASRLHGALDTATSAHKRGADSAAHSQGVAALRARRTADLGDDLAATTTQVAAGAQQIGDGLAT